MRRMAKAASVFGLGSLAYHALGLVRRFRYPHRVLANRKIRRAGAPDGLPIPPDHLLYLVSTGADVATFLRAGEQGVESIRALMRAVGKPLDAGSRVLDFGCGCGRLLRHWRDVELHGCDYNPALIQWCARHLPHAHVTTNQLLPPLSYPDDTFDLIYALSVFTHLPEEAQRPWLSELQRILRPGGVLLMTVHGVGCLDLLTPEEAALFKAGSFVVTNAEYAGTNICAAFHPDRFLREDLAAGWNVLLHRITGGNAVGVGCQDLYLLSPG